MNIVFLLFDALRASALSCYGYGKDTSPEIDKIAAQGVLFSNAFSTTNTTDPSLTTIFTGKHPVSHGIIHHGNKVTEVEKSYTENLTFLPQILQKHGFVTIGIDWLGKWHKRGYDYYGGTGKPSSVHRTNNRVKDDNGITKRRKKQSLGSVRQLLKKCFPEFFHYNWYYRLPSFARKHVRSFFRFHNAEFVNKSSLPNTILSDSAGLSDLAIKYIKRFAGKKEFFLFVHFWDNHIPYTSPRSIVNDLLSKYNYPKKKVFDILEGLSGTTAEYFINRATRWRGSDTIGEIIAYYDASIKYVDSNIRRIYQFVEKINLLDETLFIITSDHGESLVEHNIFFDHHGLYDPQIKVPLIISGPNIPTGRVYDEFVQHFDIMPTILDILGINDISVKSNGESLTGLIKNKSWDRDFVFAEEAYCQRKRMIRDKNYKYIKALDEKKCAYCEKHHSLGDEFYDLQEDPLERKNIINDARHEEYKNKLAKYINSLERSQEGKKVTFEDEEEINNRLKALGYL